MKAAALLLQPESIAQEIIDRWCSTLSNDERRRLSPISSSSRGRQSIIARQLLQALANLTLTGSWFVDTRPDGSTELIGDGAAVAASISHTQGAIFVALSTEGKIGVDIEHHRENGVARLVDRYFSPANRDAFLSAPPSQQMALFLHEWCAREALIKFQGSGTIGSLLAAPLDLPENLMHEGAALTEEALHTAIISEKPSATTLWKAATSDTGALELRQM